MQCLQGDAEQLKAHLPLLADLDLTCNLLALWESVEHLSMALPKFQVGRVEGTEVGGLGREAGKGIGGLLIRTTPITGRTPTSWQGVWG